MILLVFDGYFLNNATGQTIRQWDENGILWKIFPTWRVSLFIVSRSKTSKRNEKIERSQTNRFVAPQAPCSAETEQEQI